MQLNNNYAFSKENRVGTAMGNVQTPLVEGKTVKGEPVVTLCVADSFIPREDGAALVSRDAEGQWQPVVSINDLQTTLKSTPKDKLGEQVGIWTDSRQFLVKAKDGIPQNNEVQSLADHWGEHATSGSERYDDLGVRNGDPNTPPQQMAVGWSFDEATVNAQGVEVLPASYPGKSVGVLNEPLAISTHEILRVTEFSDEGSRFTPTAVESIKHTTEGDKTTPNAPYNMRSLLRNNAPTTLVIPQ